MMDKLNLIDRVIKGYELRECVGKGGFGAVYRAYQPTVGREVAIKVILPQHANQADFIRRFEVEAQLIARMEHPHIVPLYDYWRDPEGAYLVMRWLQGSLRSSIQRGPWSVEAASRLLEQIAAALTVAHREGIVHRDIKPDNILLDEDDNAYLADFGIAKDLSVGSITQEGFIIGSPAYITPEQIKGEPITPRTDIYSLGLVLYEVLVSEKPFPDTATPVELLNNHLNTPLPSLTTRRPNLPAALNEILQTATAKDPSHRYANVLRFAAAFRATIPVSNRLPTQPLAEPLTGREMEVLRLVVEGLSNQAIAQKFTLTIETVRWYLKQIYNKLDVHNRRQAIERARRLNLIAEQDQAEPLVMAAPAHIAKPTVVIRAKIAASTSQLVNPYKGLRAFQETDAADFFGRATLTEQLLARLSESGDGARFLVVAGPSGSGKSSVVKAGLIPALRKGALPNSAHWFITDMLPGTHPLEELEAALLRVASNPIPGLLEQLSEDRRGLARAAKRVLPADQDVELLLLIDQFEELFTLLTDEKLRTHLIDNLLSAASDPRSRVRIILTLRADFYDRPLLYPRLAELVRSHTEVIIPLRQQELERAIAGPAERVGLMLEPGLVNTIISDIGEHPGTLPLLQYALTELFERREQLTLTLDAYRASGGISGALARRADELYADLEPEGQAAARQLFLRLVTLGEGTEDTRRRVLQTELGLVDIGTERTMDEVMNAFSQYRLLTFDRDPVTRGPTVEIAHEALIREWQRLHEWLNDSRQDMHVQRRLTVAAVDWANAGQDISFLAAGARLAQFEALAADSDLALNEIEHKYLRASIAERELQERDAQARHYRELVLARQAAESAQKATMSAQQAATSQRRAANRLRYLVGGLAVFLVVAVGLFLFAFDKQVSAMTVSNDLAVQVEALKTAESQLLALQSGSLLREYSSPELATLLSLHAMNLVHTPETEIALTQAAQAARFHSIVYTIPVTRNGHVNVVFSPDGHYFLTSSETTTPPDLKVRLWNAQSGQFVRQFDGLTASPGTVAFSLDSRSVLASGAENTVLWDAQTGQVQLTLPIKDGAQSVAFSPDGRSILTGDNDGTVALWDAQSGEKQRMFTGPNDWVGASFSSDGRYILSGGYDKIARLWNASTGQEILQFNGHTDYINSVEFSPDAQYVLTSSQDGTVRLWDVKTGKLTRLFKGNDFEFSDAIFSPDGRHILTYIGAIAILYDVQTGLEVNHFSSSANIATLAFSPDGKHILVGDISGQASLIDVQGTDSQFLSGHTAGLSLVRFSPDGKYVATASLDNTARLWDTKTGQELRQFTVLTGGIYCLAFSPDGKFLLTGGGDWTARLWNVQTGQELPGFKTGGQVCGVAFSPDSKYIFTNDFLEDGATRLWDTQTGQQLRQYGDRHGAATIALSPDGKYLLTGNNGANVALTENNPDNIAQLWDVQTGQEIRQFAGGKDGGVHSVAYSHDGRYIVTSYNSGINRLWDVQTGQEMRQFIGHTGSISDVSFSPDDKYVLTASAEDRTARLWDIHTGKQLGIYANLQAPMASATFSPDGKTIAMDGDNNTVVLWNTDLDLLIQSVCTQLKRDLTNDERKKYLTGDNSPACSRIEMQTGPAVVTQ